MTKLNLALALEFLTPCAQSLRAEGRLQQESFLVLHGFAEKPGERRPACLQDGLFVAKRLECVRFIAALVPVEPLATPAEHGAPKAVLKHTHSKR
jgi:hypothetical protein